VPIYEYACKSCEHRLDALQKMNDDPLVECPECGKAALKRLLSAPRFRLKGAGWYETDFKKDNQRNLAKGDGDGEKKSKPDTDKKDTGKDSKKEVKPATTKAKAETKKTSAK
jgi:putative FmdB family regulatory protein